MLCCELVYRIMFVHCTVLCVFTEQYSMMCVHCTAQYRLCLYSGQYYACTFTAQYYDCTIRSSMFVHCTVLAMRVHCTVLLLLRLWSYGQDLLVIIVNKCSFKTYIISFSGENKNHNNIVEADIFSLKKHRHISCLIKTHIFLFLLYSFRLYFSTFCSCLFCLLLPSPSFHLHH